MPLMPFAAAFCVAAARRSTAEPTRIMTESSMPYTIHLSSPVTRDPHKPPGGLGLCTCAKYSQRMRVKLRESLP